MVTVSKALTLTVLSTSLTIIEVILGMAFSAAGPNAGMTRTAASRVLGSGSLSFLNHSSSVWSAMVVGALGAVAASGGSAGTAAPKVNDIRSVRQNRSAIAM